ncbi:MAG: glycosyltransferase family 4 protein, partial [Aggregatilineales bacterium]
PDVILFGEIRFGFEKRFLKMLRDDGLKLADIVHDVRTYDVSQGSDVVVKEDEDTLQAYNDIYSLFDALYVHDRKNYDLFLELYDVPESKVHEIPHGANEIMLEMPPSHTPEQLRTELGIPPDKPLILFFGTVARYKGIEDLLMCYRAVCDAIDVHLLVAGYPSKDTDPESLKIIAREQGIEEHITWFLDYVPNEQVVTMMQMCSVAALPYRAISQSGVVHIAYACGTPVVATRVGGLADVVEHGKSGMLVEQGDIPALSQAFIDVLHDPKKLAAMGDYARDLAQNQYSWKRVAELVVAGMEQI